MKMPIAFALVCLVLTPGARCEPVSESASRKWKSGGELDALSYATMGYYGSFFAGRDGWRGQTIVSRVNPPRFANPEGFSRRVEAYVLAVDRFFGPRSRTLEGGSAGPGVELWRNHLRSRCCPCEQRVFDRPRRTALPQSSERSYVTWTLAYPR